MRPVNLSGIFRGKLPAVMVTAGVLALCGASLLLPGWWGARQEAALLEGPLPRPAVAGLPDEQARAIPILYDLYRARLQPGNFGWQEGDAALLPGLEQCLDHLVESGVLSREMAEAVQPALDAAAAGEEDFSCLIPADRQLCGGAGQRRAGCRGPHRRSRRPAPVTALWDKTTGGVVSLTLSGDLPAADPAAMLDAWRRDLGLDVLDDWQDETQKTGVSSRSDKAQVYLYCAAEENSLRMNMTNLSGLEPGRLKGHL